MAMRKADTLRCSFCGKSQKDLKFMIAGSAASICHECVDLCYKIISDSKREAAAASATENGPDGGEGKKKARKKPPKKAAAAMVKERIRQPGKARRSTLSQATKH